MDAGEHDGGVAPVIAGRGLSALEQDVLLVVAPTCRPDLEREIDLYEEVLRLWGMDLVTPTLPASPDRVGALTEAQKLTRVVNRALTACGLNETTTYSFAEPAELDKLRMATEGLGLPVELINPMNAEQSVMRQSIIPFVEKKYSTYAEGDTSIDNLKATRYHRAYGGFSMGGGSTWNMLINNLDICAYYMPLSGHCWGGLNAIQSAIDKSGYSQREYFILAATGDQDLAYNNMLGLINPMKQDTRHFTYTSDFSQGNFYFLVANSNDGVKKTHWWGYVRWYIMDALPYFFHEGT